MSAAQDTPVEKPCKAAVAVAPLAEAEQSYLQFWIAARAMKRFTLVEIIAVASTEDCRLTARDAARHLVRLKRAGIVQEVGEVKRRRYTRAVYRLAPASNTGPQPPRFLEARMIYDPNARAMVGAILAREVAA